jgi:transposase
VLRKEFSMKEGRAEAIRAELSRIERRGQGRAYPEALRRRASEYLDERRAEGASATTVGAELGLGASTLLRWSKRASSAPSFERVVVVDDSKLRVGLLVHGPCGLRIEGLDVAGVAELVRRLL